MVLGYAKRNCWRATHTRISLIKFPYLTSYDRCIVELLFRIVACRHTEQILVMYESRLLH